jgi:hypothetical protein
MIAHITAVMLRVQREIGPDSTFSATSSAGRQCWQGLSLKNITCEE